MHVLEDLRNLHGQMKKEEGIEIKKIKKNSSKGIISLFRKPKIKIKQKIILLSTGTTGAMEMRWQGVWPVHEGVTQGRSGMAAGLQGQTQRRQAPDCVLGPGGGNNRPQAERSCAGFHAGLSAAKPAKEEREDVVKGAHTAPG